MRTKIGVVYSTTPITVKDGGVPDTLARDGKTLILGREPQDVVLPVGTVLRIIVPDHDSELADPAHARDGEAMLHLADANYPTLTFGDIATIASTVYSMVQGAAPGDAVSVDVATADALASVTATKAALP